MALDYLKARAREVGQKTLDNERTALRLLDAPGYAMHGAHLPRVKAEYERVLYPHGRAYAPEQVRAIAAVQSERNALATLIAHAAGLRAHELLTLRRAEERPPSAHRTWSPERFAGRDGVRYTVQGKGGLVREVLIPHELAQRLEARRLPEPEIVRDRKVFYEKLYDINGGQSWAKRFSADSRKVLGWSAGAHGLRHGYAQDRLRELQTLGATWRQAMAIVSQELGHFRPEITKEYLK
ncbi:MAG: site-specific integrase [Deltaproteobacteria bacterium]|nr:MAG: site-specific integrase [Deltaproteobacteria bacterium]